jgi:hypothetical protein
VAALKYKLPDASLEELFAEVAMQTGKSESYVRDAYYEWFSKKLASSLYGIRRTHVHNGVPSFTAMERNRWPSKTIVRR